MRELLNYRQDCYNLLLAAMSDPEPINKPIGPQDLERLARALDLYLLRDHMDPQVLLQQVASLEYLAYPEGMDIVKQGSEGQDLFVISKGSAQVLRDGKQVARLGPGDIFGEVAFLSSEPLPRSATVRAGEGCEVFRCRAKGFEEVLSKHPKLIESMRGLAQLRTKKLKS